MAATVRQWNMKSDIICSLFVFAEPQSVRLLLELVFSCDSFLDAFFCKKGQLQTQPAAAQCFVCQGNVVQPNLIVARMKLTVNKHLQDDCILAQDVVCSFSFEALIDLTLERRRSNSISLLATNNHRLKNPC